MDVICVGDGKNLGRVYDICITLPENRVKGLFVTGGKGFRLTRSDMLIPVSQIVKVGEDVILVQTHRHGDEKPPRRDGAGCGAPPCRPQEPSCFPHDRGCFSPDPRRDFGDYE